MKKSVIILILITTLFTSCKNNEKQEEINSSQEAVKEQVDHVLSTQWMKEIQLNDGKKWKANIETTEGVEKIKELLKTNITSSIEDYHQLANNLNELKNKVVKECTMKGASHDNLHVWLYPLIEKITALTKTNDIAEASKIRQSIIENVDAYYTYFQ